MLNVLDVPCLDFRSFVSILRDHVLEFSVIAHRTVPRYFGEPDVSQELDEILVLVLDLFKFFILKLDRFEFVIHVLVVLYHVEGKLKLIDRCGLKRVWLEG